MSSRDSFLTSAMNANYPSAVLLQTPSLQRRLMLLAGWVGGGVVICDQVTKAMATYRQAVIFNQGISFGWGQQSQLIVLVVVAAGTLGLAWWWRQWWRESLIRLGSETSAFIVAVSSGLVWGGVASNLVDRAQYGGAVRDWLAFPWLGVTNNLADLAIILGLILAVLMASNRQLQPPQRWK